MQVMANGLTQVVVGLHREGRLGGILGMAGGGGTSVATAAMRALPIGVPKLMASTLAGGDVSAYVGTVDITMMPTVVDVAGLNSISRTIYANAAAAIAGMVLQQAAHPASPIGARPLITASMFGASTPCVDRARAALEGAGYEVLVFHATGTGGRTMESLIASGFITANLDLTTTELADHVCGGVLSAGPDRMLAAARAGIPTVLAPGCVDMCNFQGGDTVPEKYHERNLYRWNPNVTLMRTTPAENRAIGQMIAAAAERRDRAGGDPAAAQGCLAARQSGRPLLGSRSRQRVLRGHQSSPQARHPRDRSGREHQRSGVRGSSGGGIAGDAEDVRRENVKT